MNGHQQWSDVVRVATGKGNKRPSFETAGVVTLRVDENEQGGRNVQSPVEAEDDDGNRLTYSLEGPGADSFTINSGTGQIRTKSGVTYDHESRDSYSLTVKVDDGSRQDNSGSAKSVTVTVRDRTEAPLAPAAPRVTGVPGSTTSVRVNWEEARNTGPPIDRYEVQYRRAGSDPWHEWDHNNRLDRSTIITGLTPGTRYEVRVRAHNSDGWSHEWSRSGTGAPNPDAANRNPAFSGGARTFSVAENTGANIDVGTLIPAVDPDGDTLTYTLEGLDGGSFDILSTSGGGQIRTSAALNHEEKSRYSVTVRVTDGRGGSDTANVTVTVTDEPGEAPLAPGVPTVTAISSTSLQVSWTAPENEGPPVIDYDYRYRGPTGSWIDVTGTTIRDTTVTISSLTASTSYDVDVRAKNDEGTSGWSGLGFGSTAPPGANSLPVFGSTSTERSVSASAAAGAAIGAPVTATDTDSGDTLAYSLEGTDAASFDIRSNTGQLVTRSGITLTVDETYTVTVAADDGTDIARIQVSIEAIAAPPNNLPVFSEGTSTTRSVARNAGAGTSIGQPLRATDADTGDTLTYSLEGADAASFGISSSTGQVLTLAGVTLEERSYNVTVVATDQVGDRATISVTITATDSPGTVSLSPTSPEVGNTVTATVVGPRRSGHR